MEPAQKFALILVGIFFTSITIMAVNEDKKPNADYLIDLKQGHYEVTEVNTGETEKVPFDSLEVWIGRNEQ